MATTQATAARRAHALARLTAGATAVAAATGQEIAPPQPGKDPAIAQIVMLEYAATVIEAAAAMFQPPARSDADPEPPRRSRVAK